MGATPSIDGEEQGYIVVVRSWGNPNMPDRVVTVCTEPDEIRSIRARYDSFKQKLAGLSGSPVFSQKSSFTA